MRHANRRSEPTQRARLQSHAYVCALACVLVLTCTDTGAQEANSSQTENASAHTVTRPICRSGAFFDAIVLMNSSMRAYAALPATDAATRQRSNAAAAELGAIMAIALKQANAEYDCIEDNLPLSYAKNYGDTLRAAIEIGTKMRVSAATLDASRVVLAQLDRAATTIAEKQRNNTTDARPK
jgi:hypothetical protein